MEDFIRDYMKNIMQGISPPIDHNIKLCGIKNNFVKMDRRNIKNK